MRNAPDRKRGSDCSTNAPVERQYSTYKLVHVGYHSPSSALASAHTVSPHAPSPIEERFFYRVRLPPRSPRARAARPSAHYDSTPSARSRYDPTPRTPFVFSRRAAVPGGKRGLLCLCRWDVRIVGEISPDEVDLRRPDACERKPKSKPKPRKSDNSSRTELISGLLDWGHRVTRDSRHMDSAASTDSNNILM